MKLSTPWLRCQTILPQDGRPAAGTPGCETGDDEKGERALAGRMRYANGCEADQRRDHAGAQSRRRFSRGPAARDRSSPAAWLSRWPALGVAGGGLAAIGPRDLVAPVAAHLLRAELQLEALAHDAGKKAANRVLLPAGGLHHRFDRCARGGLQQGDDARLLRAAIGPLRLRIASTVSQ